MNTLAAIAICCNCHDAAYDAYIYIYIHTHTNVHTYIHTLAAIAICCNCHDAAHDAKHERADYDHNPQPNGANPPVGTQYAYMYMCIHTHLVVMYVL